MPDELPFCLLFGAMGAKNLFGVMLPVILIEVLGVVSLEHLRLHNGSSYSLHTILRCFNLKPIFQNPVLV
jgi:hypothetical protein